MADPVTGYAHPQCYASSTNDCCTKVSREHPMSKGILRAVGDGKMVDVGNLWWQEDPAQIQRMPVDALAAKILCKRHNQALSRFDDAGIRVQKTLERYQLAQVAQPDPHGSEFDLVNGEEFERWILKTAWDYHAAAQDIPGNLQEARERNKLLSYMFRDGLMPRGWGLYVRSLTSQFVRAPASAVEVKTDVRENTLLGADVTLGAVTFTFATGPLKAGNGAYAVHRPSVIRIHSEFDKSCKMLAFNWDYRRNEKAELVDIWFRGPRA